MTLWKVRKSYKMLGAKASVWTQFKASVWPRSSEISTEMAPLRGSWSRWCTHEKTFTSSETPENVSSLQINHYYFTSICSGQKFEKSNFQPKNIGWLAEQLWCRYPLNIRENSRTATSHLGKDLSLRCINPARNPLPVCWRNLGTMASSSLDE